MRKNRRKILLRILKIAGRLLAAFVVFVALYFLAAFVLSRISVKGAENQPKEIALYISTNGMHTDIIMPVKTGEMDWSKEIKYADTKSKDSLQNFVAIGWGDKSFFIDVPDWQHVKPMIALKAVLALSPCAMHATYLKTVYENKDCRKIQLSRKQYARLVQYIQSYFKRDAAGNVINIATPRTYGVTDAFYEAKGRYHLFFTCNTWTNTALKKAGLRACLWTPFQQGIFRLYEG